MRVNQQHSLDHAVKQGELLGLELMVEFALLFRRFRAGAVNLRAHLFEAQFVTPEEHEDQAHASGGK